MDKKIILEALKAIDDRCPSELGLKEFIGSNCDAEKCIDCWHYAVDYEKEN